MNRASRMRRLVAAVRTDVLLQARNRLYAISVAISLLLAAGLAWVSTPQQIHATAPMAVLLIVGGSTLLYVVSMIILERDEGTLDAIVVSPVCPHEYLSAKVLTLTALAALEGAILCGGALGWLAQGGGLQWPSPWLIFAGLVGLGAMHTLVGIVLVVRHVRIMEALLPMAGIAIVLQLPALYFVGASDQPLLLAIPSAAPTMLIRGAFVELAAWQWIYAVVYTSVALVLLSRWALAAFDRHVIQGRS